MTPVHLGPETSSPGVLSRVAQFVQSPLTEKFIPLDKVRSLYERLRQAPEGFRIQSLLEEMRVELKVDPGDLEQIPASGPALVIANHPFGVLDGAILTMLLTRVRADVKVMTNFLLDDVPELKQHSIFVDPFQSDQSVHSNRRAVKQALHWLIQGGILAMFPAGEVSHWQFSQSQVADPAWNETAVRLIRRTGAAALPVYFCGQNSVGFQLLGMIHPRLRTAFLLQEFLQQEGRSVEVRIGSAICPENVVAAGDDRESTEYLRSRTYLLAQRGQRQISWSATIRNNITSHVQQPVACAPEREVLAEEIAELPQNRCLAETGDLAVYAVYGNESQGVLRELGRLRELTFRKAGEGTGKALDLDRFDAHYWHLILWHRKNRELVGAYRAGRTAEILAGHGVTGLYTSTLFRYDKGLFEKLGPALELGRSFIRPEYQRQYGPLLLLWKGIARWVACNPDTPVLFGAVSISNDYSRASREMIYRFFESRMRDDELAKMVQPRRPFRPQHLRSYDCRAVCRALRDFEDLSDPIADIESDRKGIPVLLRQYAKVGGKLLGFNVDQKFSNVLDGLIVVDMRQTQPVLLERYMGREGLMNFQHYHRLTAPKPQ